MAYSGPRRRTAPGSASRTARRGQTRIERATGYHILTVGLANLDRLEEAREAMKRMLEHEPGFTIAGFEVIYQATSDEFKALFTDSLRRCGLAG